ncbi:hypothetical protein ABT354_00335 [Streptomyces sp. NPDC000594]
MRDIVATPWQLPMAIVAVTHRATDIWDATDVITLEGRTPSA